MSHYRYTEWDGTQVFPDLDSDRLLEELVRHLARTGDVAEAIWKLQREGLGGDEPVPGNRQLYHYLEEMKRSELERPEVARALEALRRHLGEASHRPLPVPPARLHHLLALLPPGDQDTRPSPPGPPTDAPAGGGELPAPSEAIATIDRLLAITELQSQLRRNQRAHSLGNADTELVKRLAGERFAAGLEGLRHLQPVLVRAGYLCRRHGSLTLTPRAIRRIGQRALEEVFREIRRNGHGNHRRESPGSGDEVLEGTRPYEAGDDFRLHLQQTLMNAVRRRPRHLPVTIGPDDFEVVRTAATTRSATALLLDLSRSMPRHGNFEAARKVALALSELVRSRHPRDSFHVIGFATRARVIRPADLPGLSRDRHDRFTNVQQALALARQLLTTGPAEDRHVILVTDGEPTAHTEDGRVHTAYPPSPRTLELTLAEARRCARAGIRLNTFLFRGPDLGQDFARRMAAASRGRVFFTRAGDLGRYIMADYLSGRRRSL